MALSVEQFNQSPLGLMCTEILERLKEDSSPLYLTVLQLLQEVLDSRMEMLPPYLKRHRWMFQEMVVQMSLMTPDDALNEMLPREPDVIPLEAANQLAAELTMEPTALPQVLLENLLTRDL